MFTGDKGGSDNVPLPVSLKEQRKKGTLSQPSRNDAIGSCSKVIHRHIRDSLAPRRRSVCDEPLNVDYDIDNFVSTQYNAQVPIMASSTPFFSFFQSKRENLVPELKDESKIHRLVKRIVDRCHLNAEVVIIALIYIERLMEMTTVRLTPRNWIPIIVVSLLTASKVWDDHSTFNGDLCVVLPIFSITDINDLERKFLTDLSYSLHITFRNYAKYYFGLRALRKQPSMNVPKYYLKIGLGNARHVEQKTLRLEGEHRGMPLSL